MTAPAKVTYIPDIVEEHFDELQFLWTQRRNALRSSAYTEREILMLEERIEAHSEGMLVIGDRLLEFLQPAVDGPEEMAAFAAAFSLLRLGTREALTRVTGCLEHAQGKKLDGLRDALVHGPSGPFAAHLAAAFHS